jgi:FkbM family methyltransferase
MFSDYGPVVSFEPVFFEIANLNLKSNDLKNKVSMHPCALSDTIGEKIEMYLPKPVENNMINYGGTTMFPNEHHDMNSTITAITDTLDNVYKGTPSIIKMDVEGAEMNVLRGSISILKKHKPVLLIEIGDYEKSKIPDFLRDEVGYVCTPESRPECMYLFV